MKTCITMRLIGRFETITILLLTVIIGCSNPPNHTFQISGSISNAPSFVVLKKSVNLQQQSTSVVDTIFLDDQGEFSVTFFEEPHLYYLTIDNKSIPLAIDNKQQIQITGSVEEGFETKGSVDTDLLQEYEQFRKKSLQRWVGSVRDEVKILRGIEGSEDSIKALREKEVDQYEIHLDELMAFVEEKMGTSIAIYGTSLRWRGKNHLPFLKRLVTEFEKKHPSIALNTLLKDRLTLIEKTSIGGVVANIELPDISDEMTSLDESKGTYTLIDFWASWCGPCRAESDLLNDLYTNYHESGFEIYGVSFDSRQERWVQAIEKDKRHWVNVASFKGLRSDVALEFGVNALPTNFIIDEQGAIIAKNVHGKTLNETVSALFEN